MALRVFKSARAALETTRGTTLTPTRLIYFSEGTHSQDIETIYPEELLNSYFTHRRASAGTETNSFEFSGDVTYDDLIWWANLHLKGVAAGTGGAADKTWTFTPTSASDDLKTATIQFGYADSIGATRPAWEVGYCIGDELTLKWDKSPGTPGVTFSSTILSPKAATQISAYTGALSDRAVISALAINTQTYVDTATIGSTADSQVLSVEWTLKNQPVNLYTLNNTTAAQDTLRPNPRNWEAKIRRYYANDTELDAYVAKTVRKVRVRTQGAVLGGSFYKIDLDLYGVYTDRSWAEVDGLGIEEYTLSNVYDTTATTDCSLVVVNATAAIT